MPQCLLTLAATHRPEADPGYLLHEPPARIQTFAPTFGKAHVFYPEASEERGAAAALPDVDPVRPVRGVLAGWVRPATDRENTR